jgi:hypothetical protein
MLQSLYRTVFGNTSSPKRLRQRIKVETLEARQLLAAAVQIRKLEPVSKPVCRAFKRVAAGWSFSTTV